MIALALIAALRQDSVLDVPVYRNAAYAVSLPRPFPDWVFSASQGRGAITVIFHPRYSSLSEQLWGALVLTRLERAASPTQLADGRLATSWRQQLGPSFAIVSRESLEVQGLPAHRMLMRGSIERSAVEIEEYLLLRGEDLILLQFRYPRAAPRDSIASGYRRSLDGLVVRGPPPAPPPGGPSQPAERWRALGRSPWQLDAADVMVRAEAPGGPIEVSSRFNLVNDGQTPEGSVPIWLPAGLRLDSIQVGLRRAEPSGEGQARTVTLGEPVPPAGRVGVAVHYHLDTLPEAWLPLIQPSTDSTGAPRRIGLPRVNLRFELPDSLRAVASGRLTSELVATGRRKMTWSTEDETAPVFVIAVLEPIPLSYPRLTVRIWVRPGGPYSDGLVGARVGANLHGVWSSYQRVLGPVPLAEIQVVESSARRTRGSYGLILLGQDALESGVLARELARTWWGGAVRMEGPGAPRLLDALTRWCAVQVAGPLESGAGAELDSVVAEIGEPRLREVLRIVASDAKDGWLTVDDFYAVLGVRGATTLRRVLR